MRNYPVTAYPIVQMLLHDVRGNPYHLSRVVGKGGQATVYRLAGISTHLAKVYLRPRPEDEEKLAWMVANPPDDPSAHLNHASIAWPTHLLYRPDRTFAGYLMPYVRNAVALLNVFNPRLRARTLPQFDERYLHRTARNLAAALGALHARDYVVGDLNESNVMVTPETLVTMIDTDSFQVRAVRRGHREVIYPCPVGKIEYLPPELQIQSLQQVVRFPEHDRFALAVLIFQLLMEGNHPFRARWRGKGDAPPLEERLRAGWYPYRDGSGRLPVSPPENAPALSWLYPALVDLFQRCFIFGHDSPAARPAAEEWENAIAAAERALRACGRGHYFSAHLPDCPRCERAQATTRPRLAPVLPPISPDELIAKLVAEHLQTQRTGGAPVPGPMPVAPGGPPPPKLGPAFVRGLWQSALTIGLLGMGAGGLLGQRWSGAEVGSVIGIAGGLLSGAMFSETVEKRLGWPTLLGVGAAAVSVFLMWQAGFSPWMSAGAGVVGAVVGYLAGRLAQGVFWTVALAAVGAFLGNYFGGALGEMYVEAWAGGAVSGAVIGAATGVVFWAWRTFG